MPGRIEIIAMTDVTGMMTTMRMMAMMLAGDDKNDNDACGQEKADGDDGDRRDDAADKHDKPTGRIEAMGTMNMLKMIAVIRMMGMMQMTEIRHMTDRDDGGDEDDRNDGDGGDDEDPRDAVRWRGSGKGGVSERDFEENGFWKKIISGAHAEKGGV